MSHPEDPELLSNPLMSVSRRCSEILVLGHGRRTIEIDPMEELADEETRELKRRARGIRSRKRALHKLAEGNEESNSEKEEERQVTLRELERQIEVMGDNVRVPGFEREDTSLLQSLPVNMEIVVEEPSVSALSAGMWEPSFSERALERKRCFAHIYPGGIDQRHAALRALITAAGPKPSLGLRSQADLARNSLVLLTRAKEDDLLRTARVDERCCRNDYQCQIYLAHGHVPRECLSPSELTEFERSGLLPHERRPCLGCMRFNVTWFWVRMRWNGEDANGAFISGHYNLTNVKGEYSQDQTLMSAMYGLPLPVVPFNAGALRVVREDDGVVRFVQAGLVKLDSGFP